MTFLRQGLRAIEIAERVGQTRMNIYGRLRKLVKAGLIEALPTRVRRGPPKRVSDEAVVRLARQGLGAREIARRTKVATITVSRRLRRLRERGVLPPLLTVIDRGRPILELRRAGLWPIEIAARLGMQPQNVRKWLWKLRQRGVHIPKPRRLPPNFRRDLGRRQHIEGGLDGPLRASPRIARAKPALERSLLGHAADLADVKGPA